MIVLDKYENIAIFFDTNILMKNFRMDNNKFNDLLEFCDSLDDICSLCITEMNMHETQDHYNKKLDSIFSNVNKANKDLERISELGCEISYSITKENIRENYYKKLNTNFQLVTPTAEAAERVFNRYYENLKPFDNNKKEFKDALIWETIFEYAVEHHDTLVYFVSENTNDFSKTDDNGITLHDDFPNLNGRIIYRDSFDSLLETLEVLRPQYGLINQEIVNKIDIYLNDGYNVEELLMEPTQIFLFDNHFTGEYIEGWGTDPSDFVISYEIIDEEIYESNKFLYIPIQMEVNFNFSIETSNPVYEPGDEEFITESDHSCELLVKTLIAYNIEKNEISNFEDITVEFL